MTMHTNRYTSSLRFTGPLLAAFSIFCATQALAADENSSTEIPAAMKIALQRDLGVMTGQLPQYLDMEKRAIRRQGEARDALGSSFAGVWLERDSVGEFKLVLATTDRNRAANVKASGEEVRIVQHSLETLETVMAQLNRGHADLGNVDPAIHSWRVDLPSNSVVITTDPDARHKAIDFIAKSRAEVSAIRFETAKTRPQPTFDIRGGDGYLTPSVRCSIGFSVTKGANTGFATAGHCGTINTAVSGMNNVAIGYFAGSQFPGADQAWVLNNNPGSWSTTPKVNTYNGGSLNVMGNLELPVGGATCRTGSTTGWRCGVIQAKNVTVNYPEGLINGLVQSTACVGKGDSGGSFISPGGEAQGVTSGGQIPTGTNDNCAMASPVTYHQPIQPLLNSYGLILDTVQTCGRMNPGRTLATSRSVTSCDGRFTLVIQGDGNLVLYKAGVGAIWANYVFGSGHVLAMQTDGNLVVYNAAGTAVWNTGTWGRNGATLMVQNDGNVVIYNHQAQALWSTGTGGR